MKVFLPFDTSQDPKSNQIQLPSLHRLSHAKEGKQHITELPKPQGSPNPQTKPYWTKWNKTSNCLPSLKQTASLHLKMDGWKTSFLLGAQQFQGV